MPPHITVAVCTRDRCTILMECLDSLAEQDHRQGVEVLVVDNGSLDGTAERVKERSEAYPLALRVVREPTPGVAAARNRALEATEAEIVIFVDDDVTLRPNFIGVHASAFDDPEVIATGGRILPVFAEDTAPEIRRVFGEGIGGPASVYDMGTEPLLIGTDQAISTMPFGANFAVRRKAALGAGGFKQTLGWGEKMIPGEETDLLLRLSRSGAAIAYVPDAVADHHLLVSRLNAEYHRNWWSGQGRSEVILCREPLWLQRTFCLPRIGWLWIKWLIARDRVERMKLRGQISRRQGQLAEILGLG